MSNLYDETYKLQKKTMDAIDRINNNISDINSIGVSSLEELRKNSEQINDITAETTLIDKKLDISQKLQKKFDRWNGKFFSFFSNNNSNNDSKKDGNKNVKETKPLLHTKNNYLTDDILITNEEKKETDKLLQQIKDNEKIIDKSLDNISNSLDNILSMSQTINEEVVIQNNKLQHLEDVMNKVNNKQSNINQRLNKQLKK